MRAFGVGEVDDGADFSERFIDAGEVEKLPRHGGFGERFRAVDVPVVCRGHGEAFVEPVREVVVLRESAQRGVVELVREGHFWLDF